jgi:hypothetical protein
MALFRWEDIDHRLVVLKLVDLNEEMRGRIAAYERRIRFENRLNLNSNTVPSLTLQMKEERADEWAGRVYEIYCAVWQTQGYVKSAAFVRGVCAHIVRMLGVRANSIANEFSRFARRTNFPGSLRTAHLKSLDLRMRRLQSRWQRRLEIEAKECEYVERRLRVSQQTLPSARVGTSKASPEALPELFRQPSAGDRRQEVPVSERGLNRRKRGRSPKLDQSFVVSAGTLWRKAISGSYAHVSDDQLREIASALDAAGHLPPTAHLEGKYARELKAFNSRNSKSKTGPVKTWSQLISLGDKDHLRGMRRLLSRCAERLENGHPLSGN